MRSPLKILGTKVRSPDKTSEYRSAIASQSFYDCPGRTGGQKPGFLREDALPRAHGRKKPGFEESECVQDCITNLCK
ncbi:hypothetical protein Q5692_04925 [Microcoleus sp. C2C3]|uniref:hypothetical protein n=1 Tax=unclassified Microcoleus TaxID=2642155 RepID=UPI002FD58242